MRKFAETSDLAFVAMLGLTAIGLQAYAYLIG
jgi:hypothetical protein